MQHLKTSQGDNLRPQAYGTIHQPKPTIPHNLQPPAERYYSLLGSLQDHGDVTTQCAQWIALQVGVVFRPPHSTCNAQAEHIVRRALKWLRRNGCDIEGDIQTLQITRISMTETSSRRLKQMSVWREKEADLEHRLRDRQIALQEQREERAASLAHKIIPIQRSSKPKPMFD